MASVVELFVKDYLIPGRLYHTTVRRAYRYLPGKFLEPTDLPVASPIYVISVEVSPVTAVSETEDLCRLAVVFMCGEEIFQLPAFVGIGSVQSYFTPCKEEEPAPG